MFLLVQLEEDVLVNVELFMVVWGYFVVLPQISNLSLDSQYPSECYTSLDRHGLTLHIDIN